MEFLYILESIRTPFWNEVMLLLTQLGELTVFLLVALILFWCVDKKQGYYIMGVGFVGVLCNQFLKLAFRVPRPWVIDPNFTAVEAAKKAATGYSFPSGHTQCAVGAFGGFAYITSNRILRIAAIAAAIIVPFSRMYLGVHTPADVLVSLGIAVLLIFLLRPLFLRHFETAMPYTLLGMLILSVAFLLYANTDHFPEDIDPENLASGIENSLTLLGAVAGVCLVYFVDSKFLNFPVKAVWWAQILKVLCGVPLVLVVMSLLKEPLIFLLGASFGRVVRYFLVVVTAGIIWPLTFRFFGKLGKESK